MFSYLVPAFFSRIQAESFPKWILGRYTFLLWHDKTDQNLQIL